MLFRGERESLVTLSTISFPNHTFPMTFKLSRLMILGIALKRFRKSPTCSNETKVKHHGHSNLKQCQGEKTSPSFSINFQNSATQRCQNPRFQQQGQTQLKQSWLQQLSNFGFFLFTFLNSEPNSIVGFSGLIRAVLRTTAPSSTVYRSDCDNQEAYQLLHATNGQISNKSANSGHGFREFLLAPPVSEHMPKEKCRYLNQQEI